MDKDKRTVITGIGILSSCGIGRDAFWNAVLGGVSGIKPVSLFDTSPFKSKLGGEIKDFSPQEFLGPKGLRNLDRSTKLIMSAAKIALDDAGLGVSEENAQDIGIALGTTLGSLASICDFDTEGIKEGPNFVNPALFPNTVINSPASQVSIRFNIKGFNTTVSTGFTASLDAIGYAIDMLRLKKAKFVLAGGVEELCIQTFLGLYKSGCLAGSHGEKMELSCPFDKRRNGIVFGEGAGLVVLEELESALQRKAHIYAEVLGFAIGFDCCSMNRYNSSADGLKRAMHSAMQEAGLDGADIDYISAGANSTPEADLLESAAIKEVFGKRAKDVAVSAIKSVTGECFSASGIKQVVAGLGAIEKQRVPPTINYEEKDPECNLSYVVNRAQPRRIEKVLVNNFGPSGCNSSLIISKYNG